MFKKLLERLREKEWQRRKALFKNEERKENPNSIINGGGPTSKDEERFYRNFNDMI